MANIRPERAIITAFLATGKIVRVRADIEMSAAVSDGKGGLLPVYAAGVSRGDAKCSGFRDVAVKVFLPAEEGTVPSTIILEAGSRCVLVESVPGGAANQFSMTPLRVRRRRNGPAVFKRNGQPEVYAVTV